jgi:hypothetical protein
VFAGGILAVLALDRQKPRGLLVPFGKDQELALALGQVVALVAGQFAGATAHAFVEIDEHCILGLGLSQGLVEGDPTTTCGDEQAAGQAGFDKAAPREAFLRVMRWV